MNLIIVYSIIINITAILLMKYDKFAAINKKHRISEKTLISISFLGGAIGIILSMYFFHHKNRKIKFLILTPISLLLHILIIFIILK